MSMPAIAQSLPPEILVFIINDVIEGTAPDERSLMAMRLTHVSASFRRVALDCPKLWTCLSRKHGRPGLELIKACIERSKGQPLDVVLYFYADTKPTRGFRGVSTFGVDSIARLVIPLSARWKRFSARLLAETYSGNLTIPVPELMLASRNLKAPLLKEFAAEDSGPFASGLTTDDYLAAHSRPVISMTSFLPSWNLPGLHSFALQNVFPSIIPIKYHTQLRYLEARYINNCRLWDLSALPSFLGMTKITSLYISLHNCHFSRAYATARDNDRILPHIQSLQIDFLGCSQLDWTHSSLWNTFKTFRFPETVDLRIVLDVGDATFGTTDGDQFYDLTLHSFLTANPPQSLGFSRVEVLDLDVHTRPDRELEGKPPTLLLQYSSLPSLKHLRIRSRSNLNISDVVGDADTSLLPEHFALSTGDDSAPFALQTITFDFPCVDGVAQWVKDLIPKMKDHLCWDSFRDLTMKTWSGVPQIIHRDNLEQWCEDFA